MFKRRPGRQKPPGLFADGIWHCDCDCSPRLPAEHFVVKKESPNKGHSSHRSFMWLRKAQLIPQKADGSTLVRIRKVENAACSYGTTMLDREKQRLS
jgi:hypothetical protein